MHLQNSSDNSVAGLYSPLSHVTRAVSCKISKISHTSTSVSTSRQSLKYASNGFDNTDEVKNFKFFINKAINPPYALNFQGLLKSIISFRNTLTSNCSTKLNLLTNNQLNQLNIFTETYLVLRDPEKTEVVLKLNNPTYISELTKMILNPDISGLAICFGIVELSFVRMQICHRA